MSIAVLSYALMETGYSNKQFYLYRSGLWNNLCYMFLDRNIYLRTKKQSRIMRMSHVQFSGRAFYAEFCNVFVFRPFAKYCLVSLSLVYLLCRLWV
jgi:hypothetical protein